MKFKYDTTTDDGKADVMKEFARTKKPPLAQTRNVTQAGWYELVCPDWNWSSCDFNYPLEPKLVPWTLKTAPKVGVLFEFNDRPDICYLPEAFTTLGISFTFQAMVVFYTDLMILAKYSVDCGTTWLPCGTEE